jgi:hypothetical protein
MRIGTDMSASVYKSNPLGRKTGYLENGECFSAELAVLSQKLA